MWYIKEQWVNYSDTNYRKLILGENGYWKSCDSTDLGMQGWSNKMSKKLFNSMVEYWKNCGAQVTNKSICRYRQVIITLDDLVLRLTLKF